MSTNKQALRQLAVDAKELAIIKRYTKGIEAQKKFIAAANPATVLALLDELEARTASETLYKASLKQADAELEAAAKRIAEMEARSVVIPDDLDFDCEFESGEYGSADEPWLRGRVDGFNTGMKEITKAIRAAGITVKGDSE